MTPSCHGPILCLLLSYPGAHQWNYTGLWSYSLSTEPLFSLQRSLSVRVKINKTVVDLLTSSVRGWGWGKEKIGTLQPPSCAPCTFLHACFAHRLIDLKKKSVHRQHCSPRVRQPLGMPQFWITYVLCSDYTVYTWSHYQISGNGEEKCDVMLPYY